MPTTEGRIYLGSVLVAGGTPLDPDAQSYITAIEGDGVSVSYTQKAALSDFVVSGKDEGWYSELKRLYLPVWEVAAANARCLVSASSATFSGTVAHSAGFVKGDGSTGYLDVAQTMAELSVDKDDIAYGFLIKTAGAAAGTRAHMAWSSNSSNSTYSGFGHGSGGNFKAAFGSITDAAAFVTAAPTYVNTDGIFLASRKSGTSFVQRRLNSGSATLVSEVEAGGGSNSTKDIAMMAFNYNGSMVTFSDAEYGSFFVSDGLISSEAEAFTADLETLWETCTGLTLP